MSDNTKRGLGILNKICLTMLVCIFLGLVDVWFLQEMAGDYNVADFEKQITGDNLTASDFEDTVETALLQKMGQLETYQCSIDEEIFRMRNEDFMVIYYRAVGVNEESFIYANFRTIEQDGQEKYALVNVEAEVRSPMDQSSILTAREHIYYQTILALGNFINYANEDDDESGKQIAYGDICEDCWSEEESIYNLQIDGQKPDEIVEYECFGKKYYFWYYDDLKADETISEEWITLTEDEEKDNGTMGSGDGNEETVSMTPEEQIDIFADEVEEWSRGLSVGAAFAVADLNQDGRLELITDDIRGSGHFAYNNYFLVNKDGAMEELESGRFGEYLSTYYDLADGLIHVPVYYDEKEDVFYSIQGGGTRDTHPISFCWRLVSLSIKNDVVEEELLACRICEMDENNNWITPDRYEDADGNEIAEEEFETIAERKYSDLKQMQMTWKWHNYTEEEIGAMSKEELKELLMDSYENFELLEVGL